MVKRKKNKKSLHQHATARSKRKAKARKTLSMEPLEERRLLAGDFQLAAIQASDGTLLGAGSLRNSTPGDLTLVFSKGQTIDPATLDAISVTRSADGVFGNGNDITVTTGFVGIGKESNEVVVRFAETLPDDAYRVTVEGTLSATDGTLFNEGDSANVPFELDLAPQVVSVVPQPIRLSGSSRVAARNQIDVYFNDDTLDITSAQNPAFYQLTHTNDTVSTNDDGDIINPTSVVYSALENKATLTFAADIEDLGMGGGTFRLRVGNSQDRADAPLNLPDPPQSIFEEGEPGETVDEANTDFGTLDTQPKVISNQITAFTFGTPEDPIFPVYPGSETDPGHRLVNFIVDRHVTFADNNPGLIETREYNFRSVYGIDQNNNQVVNQITDAQKQRAREALEIYGYYLGIQFIETPESGFTIATGNVNTVLGPFAAGFDFDALGAAGSSFIPTDDGETEPIDVAVVNGGALFDANFGGTYFQQVMQEIGHVLGYGEASDLGDGTIFAGEQIEDFFNVEFPFVPERDREAVFPSEHDILHGQYMYNPNANDIDFYRFDVAESGKFSAETFAQRQQEASSLDTVLRLFRETSAGIELVAQNDDYFGNDSAIEVDLSPGTYYIAVSSTGNEVYDPTLFSGGMGTSSGVYDLRVQLQPTVAVQLTDATGQALDGDADGRPGGTHNFWFRAVDEAETLYVNKTSPSGGNGSLTTPFNTINAAMTAAQAGDVVRVLGNNFGDNDPTNEIPYAIGFDNLGNVLADGSSDGTLKVKKDVVLMIDEGAMFKMRRGAILVGSDSSLVDRSGGSIQVLGTPANSVIFTSINDETVGADVDSLSLAPRRGDWGGIRIRRDVDDSADLINYENEGIFLDTIIHADVKYGGGVLAIGSVSQAVNPITLVNARPSIAHNTLTFNADAAMSATPNSFKETNFRAPEFQDSAFTPDYDRVGPDIHDNHLTDNTTNGIFIVDRRGISSSFLRMDTSSRFNDTDITHVIADTLLVAGNPGGPVRATVGEPLEARLSGRLAIDPGVVVKLDGGRIEVGIGADLYAEGTGARPIVFTSLLDDRFGAGGTFDTNNSDDVAAAENWGGVMARQTSRASFANVVMAYGGGTSPIEGAFAGFNVLEVHQADVRLANSTLEFNGDGTTSSIEGTRSGRGLNASGTVYIRGSQPVIIGNTFRNNADAVIDVDVNSLNHHLVKDPGRSLGPVGRVNTTPDNQGPLVRGNIIDANGTNGMVIRGGEIQGESVWDDTDIVHVLFDSVIVPNFHSFGGLRLKSSPTQSLVMKAFGETAGFITSGSALGIADHIGGSIEVAGQPGNPVIMTSFYDDTVGAGLDQQGQTQVDTDGGGRPTRTMRAGEEGSFQIELNYGPAIREFPELMDAARLAANIWEEQLQDDMVVSIDVDLTNTLSQQPVAGFNGAGLLTSVNPPQNNFGVGFGFVLNPSERITSTNLFQTSSSMVSTSYGSVSGAMMRDAGAHESIISQLPANLEALNVQFPENVQVPFDVATEMELTSANALALGLSGTNAVSQFDPEMPRDGAILITDNLDLFDLDRTDGLKTYREDFQTQFMTQIGEILGFSSSLESVEFFLDNPVAPDGSTDQTVDIPLSPLDLFRFAPGEGGDDFTNNSRLMDPQLGDHVFYAGGNLDFRVYPFEGIQVGDIPIGTGYDSQRVGDELNDNFPNRWRDDIFFRNGRLVKTDTIGIMDPFSIIRDEVLQTNDSVINTQGMIIDVSEADRLAFDAIGYDVVGGAPGDWAGIRLEQLTYDGNVSYATERETTSTRNDLTATAQTLGSLAENRNAGNEELRLGFEVHGLVQSPDDVDTYNFRGTAGSSVWIDLDNTDLAFDSYVQLVNSDGDVLAASDNSLFESNGVPLPENDAGYASPFTEADLYSTNVLNAGMRVDLPGPAGLESTYYVQVLGVGETVGRYELQIRLQETDDVPGTAIEFADIRYATTGIDVIGPPSESPLLGEASEDETFNDFVTEYTVNPVGDDEDPANRYTEADGLAFNKALPYDVAAQYLGDLTKTRTGAISVAGNLSDDFGFFGGGDVDWYRFDVLPEDRRLDTTGVVFDIDFADGLGGPDTAIAVYEYNLATITSPLDPNVTRLTSDLVPNLIYYSEGSNLAADQATIGDTSVITGGSFGTQDPFIGPVTLTGGIYYVAVSPVSLIPESVVTARQDNVPLLQPNFGDANRGFAVDPTLLPPGIPSYAFNPNAPFDAIDTGEYQLEIRVAPISVGGNPTPDPSLLPDVNRERIQGQLVISNNEITDSRGFGIRIQDGRRDQRNYGGEKADIDFTNDDYAFTFRSSFSQEHGQFNFGDWTPPSGTARFLPGLNEERVVPGITIANNVIANGMDGGIMLQGDPNGIVMDVYDVSALFAAVTDYDSADLDGSQFTVWDHYGNSQVFQFTTSGDTDPDKIPIRFDADVANDLNPTIENELLSTASNPPTAAPYLAAEIAHALTLSDLDIKVYVAHSNESRFFGRNAGFPGPEVEVYRTSEDDTTDFTIYSPTQIFIEGAAEIGMPDVVSGTVKDAFSPPDAPVSPINAYIPQQGAVTYARIINNTLVGRGGDLMVTNAEGEEQRLSSHGVRDVGIVIEDNASPTLLNNIIANFETGIRSDLSANDSNAERRTFVGSESPVSQANLGPVTVITSDADPIARANFGVSFAAAFPGSDQSSQHRDVENSPTPYVGARPTIVGATIYQGNADDNFNISRGDFAINLADTAPLFVDPINGNYFLSEGSRAIDSSIDFLSERDYLTEVMEAAGITTTSIEAPNIDAIGILRVDDPSIEPPDGLGSNVFKDRGALERADFVGPTASLIDPLDNDPDGIDQDSGLNSVAVLGELLTRFELNFTDSASLADPVFGSGVDDTTVTSEAIIVRRNGEMLLEDEDYFLTYDQTNNRLRVIPVAGVWTGGTYEVELVRDAEGEGGIRDRSDNPIRPNRADGTTQFVIAVNEGVDFNDAPLVYGNASHEFVDGFQLGEFVTVESEPNSNETATGDFGDDGVVLPGTTLRGSLVNFTVTASAEGRVSGWIDWNVDGDFNDPGEEIISSGLVVAGDNLFSGIAVPGDAVVGPTFARFRFSSEAGLAPTGAAIDGEVEDYQLFVEENPWRNPRDPFDVNDNGSVAPLDALLVINELNNNEVSDPTTGALPAVPPPNFAPPFVDVNGDGFVSPIDALLVINQLNNPSAALSGSAGVDLPREEREGNATPRASSAAIVDFAWSTLHDDEENDRDSLDAFADYRRME